MRADLAASVLLTNCPSRLKGGRLRCHQESPHEKKQPTQKKTEQKINQNGCYFLWRVAYRWPNKARAQQEKARVFQLRSRFVFQCRLKKSDCNNRLRPKSKRQHQNRVAGRDHFTKCPRQKAGHSLNDFLRKVRFWACAFSKMNDLKSAQISWAVFFIFSIQSF